MGQKAWQNSTSQLHPPFLSREGEFSVLQKAAVKHKYSVEQNLAAIINQYNDVENSSFDSRY